MSERLPKKYALPVFSSDAISSTAYATEEMLLALVTAGVAAMYSIYIAIAVVVLLVFVALSYQQTVHAYPNGGGSYVVSRENLGLLAGHHSGRLVDGGLRYDGRGECGLRRGGHHGGFSCVGRRHTRRSQQDAALRGL